MKRKGSEEDNLLAEDEPDRSDTAVFVSVSIAALGPLSFGYALGFTRRVFLFSPHISTVL